MAHAIRTVGVIGTGVIGASWTALFLAKGLQVIVSDPAPGALKHLKSYIQKEWPSLERIGVSPGASPDNFEFVDNVIDHLEKVDFVQENAPERLDFKTKLFAQIDAKAPPRTIIASSSSGIPSSEFITDCKKDQSRILIGHPFNPPHLVPLVEVVPHPGTDDEVTSRTLAFYRSLGKSPILVKQETPGFVANRLQAALGGEAYSLVQRGIVSACDLDTAVTTDLGLRWALTGPFMTNVLGGGGGKEGFRHLLEHLGPAVEVWEADMEKHKFTYTKENMETLNKDVSSWIEHVDLTEMEKERDDVLLDLLQLKQNAKALT